jgi:chromosome segregation ATPase
MTWNLRRALLAATIIAAFSLAASADEKADAARPAGAHHGSGSKELRRLRRRIAALEQEVARARILQDDAQAEALRELSSQLAALRAELSQAQANAAAAQVSYQQQREQLQRSIATLIDVQERLKSGDAEVLDALDAAAPALPFPAQALVQDARAALAREDLSAARYSLAAAIENAERAQLVAP